MTDWLSQRCIARDGGTAFAPAEVERHLAQLSGWRLSRGAIEKTYAFANYHETIAFMNALAWICHAEDHHPETTLTYDRCVVRFDTHAVGGISANDFICAAKADALVASVV